MPPRRTRTVAADPTPEAPPLRESAPKKRGTSPLATLVIVAVLFTAFVLGAKGFFSKKGKTDQVTSPAAEQAEPASDEDIQKLIARVSAHIVVKRDESPTVATIQDAAVLRQQSPVFYKDAQNGDRLLIWSDKAVLYSPTQDIILAVLPVSVAPGGTVAATSTSDVTPVKEEASIEIRNGSPISGRGRLMADKLKAAGLTVLPATDAKVKTYATTVIIVRDAEKPLPNTLQTLKDVTGGEVIAAPVVEGAIKGDFLVIVGADFTP